MVDNSWPITNVPMMVDHERLTIGNHISRRQVHGTGSADGGTISVNINVGDDLVEGVL